MAIKIWYDEENHRVYAGDKFFVKYVDNRFKSRSHWVAHVIAANEIAIPTYLSKKDYNKAVCDAFGCSSVVLHKHFVKLMNKVFIADMIPLIKNRPYTFRKKLDSFLVMANENHKIMKQLKSDKLEKLGPLCAISGKTPQELKQYYGKGAWKQICSSSPTRIGLIASYSIYNSGGRSGIFFKKDYKTDSQVEYHKIPSSILKQTRSFRLLPSELNWILTKCKGKWSKCSRLVSYYRDYLRMARQLDIEPEEVTGENVKQLHDRLTTELNMRYNRSTYEPFQYPVDYKAVLSSVEAPEGYSIHVFENTSELVEEGREMRHCVGSYANAVKKGRSLIISIKKDDKRYSTMEWKISESGYSFGQNMQKCNRRVDDSVVVNWVNNMTKKLNEKEN